VLVQVEVVAAGTVACLAEDDEFVEEKDVSERALVSVRHDELALAHQHTLLVQVHLHSSTPCSCRFTCVPHQSDASATIRVPPFIIIIIIIIDIFKVA